MDLRNYKTSLDKNFNFFSLIKTKKLEKLFLCHSNMTVTDSNYLYHVIKEKWSESLVELDLSWSTIDSSALKNIFECLIANDNICKLQRINLTGTSVDTEIIKYFFYCLITKIILNNNNYRMLVKGVKSLDQVNLTSCRSVERGMKRIITKSDFEKIA